MILDTNALSAAAERDPSAMDIVARAERLAVPVIVLGEYRLGIAQSRYRASYEAWLQEWSSSVAVLDIDLVCRVLNVIRPLTVEMVRRVFTGPSSIVGPRV